MLLVALTLSAYAGKLADGFRGVPFGPDSILASAPMPEGCTEVVGSGEKGIRWECATTINDASVNVYYFVEAGWFYSVRIDPAKQFTQASLVREAMLSAWGPCMAKYPSDPMMECTWIDGKSKALWEYNRFNQESSVTMMDVATFDRVKAARLQRAKASSSDL